MPSVASISARFRSPCLWSTKYALWTVGEGEFVTDFVGTIDSVDSFSEEASREVTVTEGVVSEVGDATDDDADVLLFSGG